MNVEQKLIKSLPALGKFGIWLGISALTSQIADSREIEEGALHIVVFAY